MGSQIKGFPAPRSRGSSLEVGRSPGRLFQLELYGISISGNAASENEFITIEQKGKNVSLICEGGDNKTRWIKDRMDLTYQGKELALAVMDDPRGIYKCITQNGKSRSLQVFIRMCQNCIHLDFTMILGISAASLLATVFLAIAVYHIAVEEQGRPTQEIPPTCCFLRLLVFFPCGLSLPILTLQLLISSACWPTTSCISLSRSTMTGLIATLASPSHAADEAVLQPHSGSPSWAQSLRDVHYIS